MMSTKKYFILVLNAVSYLAVLVVNYLAQSGMLGTMSTSEISDKYLNLFTPGGYVFMIWGLIYLLLGAYIVYQFVVSDKTIVMKVAPCVFATNILNILWLLSWHFSTPLVSLIVILILLLFLVMIVKELRDERILPKTTFTIYYAWITVASIASVFAFLASAINIPYDNIWFVVLTDIALAMVALLMVTVGKSEMFGYILTLLWATVGIFVNHIVKFDGMFLSVMVISVVVIIIGVSEFIYYLCKRKSSL